MILITWSSHDRFVSEHQTTLRPGFIARAGVFLRLKLSRGTARSERWGWAVSENGYQNHTDPKTGQWHKVIGSILRPWAHRRSAND
jgi:hypothetical protein